MKRIMAALLALSAPSQQLHDDHQHPHRGGDAGKDQPQRDEPVYPIAIFRAWISLIDRHCVPPKSL